MLYTLKVLIFISPELVTEVVAVNHHVRGSSPRW